jgi:hypothetical protein
MFRAFAGELAGERRLLAARFQVSSNRPPSRAWGQTI